MGVKEDMSEQSHGGAKASSLDTMLTEKYFAAVSGPPIANNTAINKDVGIYEHTLHPSHSTTATFKKSSVPCNSLAFSDSHVFAAQDDKSTVHIYSRVKGNTQLRSVKRSAGRVLENLRDEVMLG